MNRAVLDVSSAAAPSGADRARDAIRAAVRALATTARARLTAAPDAERGAVAEELAAYERYLATLAKPAIEAAALVGIDGCREGWVAAILGADKTVQFRVFSAFGEIRREVEAGRFRRVVIDMPIGLATAGRRRVDHEAKRILGARQMCVFYAPERALLDTRSREEADALRRGRGGPGVTIQEFAIMPKMAEIDAAMAPELQHVVREGHPEVTCCRLAGEPVRLKKDSVPGAQARLALIRREFEVRGWPTPEAPRVRGAERDDVIDALLMLVSAIRLDEGGAVIIPVEPEIDERGLRAEMVS